MHTRSSATTTCYTKIDVSLNVSPKNRLPYSLCICVCVCVGCTSHFVLNLWMKHNKKKFFYKKILRQINRYTHTDDITNVVNNVALLLQYECQKQVEGKMNLDLFRFLFLSFNIYRLTFFPYIRKRRTKDTQL